MTLNATGRRPPWAAFTIAAGLCAVGAVMLWDAAGLRDVASYSGVGPKAIPRIVAGGLIILGLWTAVAGWRGDFDPAPRQEPAPVLWILGGLGLQLLLLHWAGFIIATGLLFGLTARGFGQRNLALAVGIGVILSLLVYAVFDRLLRLNLPGGPLENLIFGG